MGEVKRKADEARREASRERAAARAERTDAEQIARLDEKFGPGQGATRERARLAAKGSA